MAKRDAAALFGGDFMSHRSTVEKLYAWEKKLYLEVKVPTTPHPSPPAAIRHYFYFCGESSLRGGAMAAERGEIKGGAREEGGPAEETGGEGRGLLEGGEDQEGDREARVQIDRRLPGHGDHLSGDRPGEGG